NAFAWSNLGAVYDAQGRDYEAIQAYKRSLEANSNQPAVLVNLGTVYINQGRLDTAERVLKKALEMSPDLAVAHERLGYCCWKLQQIDKAIESYNHALEIDSDNSRAMAGLGVVRMTQFLHDPARTDYRDQAIEMWHSSLERDANQPHLREL